MSKLPEKVTIQQIQEGESVSPDVANRPHSLLEQDIDNIRAYLKDSPVEHFNVVNATTTTLTYAKGVIKNTAGQMVTIAQGTIITGAGDHYIQIDPSSASVIKDTQFQASNIPLYHVNVSGSTITINDYRTWYGATGGGSGTNADTLDGQDGTYYLDLANHTGTITDTQHGARGGGSLHTTATTTEAGFMSSADKQVVNDAVTSASNVGSGVGVYRQKTGRDLEIKSLIAGSNITLTDNGDSITIDSTGGSGGHPVQVDGNTNIVSVKLAENVSDTTRHMDVVSRFSTDVSLEFRFDGANEFLTIDRTGVFWALNNVNKEGGTYLKETIWRIGYNSSQHLTIENNQIQFVNGLGQISNVSDPVNSQDVATKNYVDLSVEWIEANYTGTNPPVASNNGVAIGNGAIANLGDSISIGRSSASGNYGVAVGQAASASNNFAVAIGQGTQANQDSATAVGRGSIANAESFAGGRTCTSGYRGVALGYDSQSFDHSIAIGNNPTAGTSLGGYSIAISTYPVTVADESMVIQAGALSTETGLQSEANGKFSLIGTSAHYMLPMYPTTSLPTTTEGAFAYDQTTKEPVYHDGSGWKSLGGGGGFTPVEGYTEKDVTESVFTAWKSLTWAQTTGNTQLQIINAGDSGFICNETGLYNIVLYMNTNSGQNNNGVRIRIIVNGTPVGGNRVLGRTDTGSFVWNLQLNQNDVVSFECQTTAGTVAININAGSDATRVDWVKLS